MSTPTRYVPPRQDAGVDLDLSKNEGRLPDGYSPWAVAEMTQLNRYPDTSRLVERIARRHQVDEEQVLVTAGGDECLLRCFLWARDRGLAPVTTEPTFEMIPTYAEQTGSALKAVAWWDGVFPLAEIVALGGADSMVFVVSPNNPTGSVIGPSDLAALSAVFRAVVLDAAYTEFADLDVTLHGLALPNVLVVRTLSKAWGLAGLRVGYVLGPAMLVSEIASFGSPYPISAPSAAIAADRLDWPADVEEHVSVVRMERAQLTEVLRDEGVEVFPSQANFVLAKVDDAVWVRDAAAALGVGLRIFPDRPGLDGHVRVTLPGESEPFDRLTHALLSAIAPEALVFDMDGVLADVTESQIVAIMETANAFGVRVSRREVLAAQAAGNANDDWELTRRICVASGIDVSFGEVKRTYEDLYQGTDPGNGLKERETPLVDPTLFERWASRFPLAVVTGRPRTDAEEFLGRTGMDRSISVLVTREEAPLKPDPAPVRLALERLGVTRAWMLGDTVDDISAARAAGVVPIAVTTTPHADGPPGAARTLRKTTDLEDLLP